MATTLPPTIVQRWHEDWNAMADAMFANDGAGAEITTTVNGNLPLTDPYIYAVGGRLRWSSQEQRRMNDLLIATEVRHAVATSTANGATNGVLSPDVTAFLNTTANTYRAVVEMAKKLNDFSTLTEHQRLGQLRESAPDMSVLYSVAQDMDIKWPEDGVQQLSIAHANFVHSFAPDWRVDREMMTMLMAIALFTGAGVAVAERRAAHLHLLLCHLLARCGERARAQRTFVELLDRMRHILGIHEEFAKFVRALDRTVIDPLLLELIDSLLVD